MREGKTDRNHLSETQRKYCPDPSSRLCHLWYEGMLADPAGSDIGRVYSP